ncbi:MAG: MauE/DoxX family redox-associated membrane protein [Pirellulaceae bacterium]
MAFLIRVALGLLFAYSGAIKLLDIARFADHVGDFGIVTDSLVPAVAWAIAAFEIVAGVGLLYRWSICLVGIATLLLGYLLVLSYGIAIGLDVQCGCLGSDYRVAMSAQIVIDVGLLSLVFLLAIFDVGVSDGVSVKRPWFGGRVARDRGDHDRAGRLRDESISAGSAD